MTPYMEINQDSYVFYRCDMDIKLAKVWSKILNQNSKERVIRIECHDGYYIHAHHQLISTMCTHIKEIFQDFDYHRIDHDQEIVITLPTDITRFDLIAIINFIYHGITHVKLSRLQSFLNASKMLMVNGLKDIEISFEDDQSDQPKSSPKVFTKINEKPTSTTTTTATTTTTTAAKTTTAAAAAKTTTITTTYGNSSKHYQIDSSLASLTSFKPLFSAANTAATSIKRKYSNIFSSSSSSSSSSSGHRTRIQGRRPQLGSPLITEDFKYGDRYLCRVCERGYLWKKSLVRHYKDYHPGDVEVVTAETRFD